MNMKAFLTLITGMIVVLTVATVMMSDQSMGDEEEVSQDHELSGIDLSEIQIAINKGYTSISYKVTSSFNLNEGVTLSSDLPVTVFIYSDADNICNITRGETNGSLFVIKDSVALILKDIVIEGNDKIDSYIDTDGNVSTKNTATSSLITVSGGSLTINEGTSLRNNYSTANGGAILVNGGKVIMNGGSITCNIAKNGGAVRIDAGYFTMNDGSVGNNIATNNGGAFAVAGNKGKVSSLEIVGGSVSNNRTSVLTYTTAVISTKTPGWGGAIHLFSTGPRATSEEGWIVSITGGVISDNKSAVGGAISVLRGTLSMSAGTISGNTAVQGGAVRLIGGTFNMNGGTISGNTADNGNGGALSIGASRIDDNCYTSFFMTGGEIVNNQAIKGAREDSGFGSAIHFYEYDNDLISMRLMGGSIGGNIADTEISVKKISTELYIGNIDFNGVLHLVEDGAVIIQEDFDGFLTVTDNNGYSLEVNGAVMKLLGTDLKFVQNKGVNLSEEILKIYDVNGKTYTIKHFKVTWSVDGTSTDEVYHFGELPAFTGSTDKASDSSYMYTFKGWDEDISMVSEDVTYTAVYEQVYIPPYYPTVPSTPPVSETPAIPDVKVDVVSASDLGAVSGSGLFASGSTVIVTATPADGFIFEGWYDGDVLVSTDANYAFIADKDILLSAQFRVDALLLDQADSQYGVPSLIMVITVLLIVLGLGAIFSRYREKNKEEESSEP